MRPAIRVGLLVLATAAVDGALPSMALAQNTPVLGAPEGRGRRSNLPAAVAARAQERTRERNRRPGQDAAGPKASPNPAAALLPQQPPTPPPGVLSSSSSAGSGFPASSFEFPGEKEFNSCKKIPAGKRVVKLNTKPDTEVADLVRWISSISCRQFIVPSNVQIAGKKVTIIAPQLITPEEAYRLFLVTLESAGLTVEPTGKFLRIVDSTKAARVTVPLFLDDDDLPPGQSYVTRLVRLKNADANEISQVLAKLKSDQGDITVYAPQGTLIITDSAPNVERMLAIVEELDVTNEGDKIWMLRMKNVAATEMAVKLAEIFQVQQLGGRVGAAAAAGKAPAVRPPAAKGSRAASNLASEMTITKMIPDERTNQLIIIADERAYARLLTLLRKLDVPVEGGDGRIHVYYCENANCDELARTLGAVTGVSVSGGGTSRSRTRGGAATPAAPTTPMPGAAGGAAGQNASMLFEGEVRIAFDAPTNALIVISSLKDFQALRRVIERLDSPRKQVFVEATVLEVLLDKRRDLGVAYHGGFGQDVAGKEGIVLGGFDSKKTLSPAGLLTDSRALSGLGAGIFGPALPGATSLFGSTGSTALSIPSFGAFLMALQEDNDVNVLSSPHITITNNEEGEIVVGRNVPFQGAFVGGLGGAAGALGGLALPSVSVNRQDVALKMKLVPHVNEHNMIRLEVDQEISDIAAENFNGLGPATSKRTAKTVVVTKDQQTIVIGGLIGDRVADSVTKIPILGDIPILGFLFRRSTKTVQKTNILIALTAYVVDDQSDLRRIVDKKMRERREFMERFGKRVDRADLTAELDYRNKRGMLEEVNRAAREAEVEEDTLRKIRDRDMQEEAGPLDMPPIAKPPAGRNAPAETTTPPPAPAMPL